MEFTFYGQSCFSLNINKTNLLFDPFITGNEHAKHIDIKTIHADYILVSHGHEDHTADLVTLAKQTGAKVIANFEIISWLQNQGITNVHPMNFGTVDFNFGTLTFFQAMHSSVLADGTYAGNPGGFILKSDGGNIYYSGDTSLFMDMQLVPYYAKVDVAFLPIGGNFTMNAKEAIYASELIKCNHIVGLHFDTFNFIKINHEETKKTLCRSRKRFPFAGDRKILHIVNISFQHQ